ncbi:MAG: hypothetical protein ABEL76_06225, partial [Bradymonadaceae bacterium]
SLLESLDEHRDWLEASGEAEARRRRRVEELMRLVLGGEFDARLEGMLDTDLWDRRVAALMEGDRAPYETADELLNRMFAED